MKSFTKFELILNILLSFFNLNTLVNEKFPGKIAKKEKKYI